LPDVAAVGAALPAEDAGGFRHATAPATVATTSIEENSLVKTNRLEWNGRVNDGERLSILLY